MSTLPQRQYLGSFHGFNERMRIFRTEDALEVDSSDRYEIRRRRVFFDEVLLATLHQERGGGPYPWMSLVLALFGGLLALAFQSEPKAFQILLACAVGFALLALGAFLIPTWIVTVYGKRARGRIRYRLREGKARGIYAEICQAAAEAQRALVERQSPPPDLPLPPTPDSPSAP